jgi:hypothetical protein
VKVGNVPSVTASSVEAHLSDVIRGTPVDFSDATLSICTDIAKVKKLYKLSEVSGKQKKGVKHSQQATTEHGPSSVIGRDKLSADERMRMEVSILGIMALKGW